MKTQNEKLLEKNIQDCVEQLNNCSSELEKVNSERKKCQENIFNSGNELSIIDSNNFVSVENAGDAIKEADSKTSRKKELMDIVNLNQGRYESLGIVDSNLSMKISGLEMAVRSAREAYCKAYQDAMKNTAEWKSMAKHLEMIKALWSVTFSGNIYVEDIITDLGLNNQAGDSAISQARIDLAIK